MRQSQLFGKTLRDNPADAQIPSHQLLVRAGFIRQLGAGLYTLMPLAMRSALKIEQIIREEMNAVGGQEIEMPLVQPAELWRETGRYEALAGRELLAFKDHKGRENVLAMTHEEAVTAHARTEISSYRQLPLTAYQIQLKYRDELRVRAGLIRCREFKMKDAYSFHANEADLDETYERMYDAYARIYERCGVPAIAVESDSGMMGGTESHEFMLVAPSGEDRLALCKECGYTANVEVAVFEKGKRSFGDPLPMEQVETPNREAIQEVADYLSVPTAQTIKAVLYMSEDGLVYAGIRGDLEVNETKLANAVGKELRPAEESEIHAAGIVPGYASPIGAKPSLVVVDDSLLDQTNGVAGANREGFHFKNVNIPRDFAFDICEDIALAQDGSICSFCGGALETANGIEVGNIFKLGVKYGKAMGATFLDENGRQKPIIMGSYGIGVGRLLASAVEANYDADGILFPVSVAPFQTHLVPVGKGKAVQEAADALYEKWTGEGFEVLYDDRNESPGVKFKDSDLIGLPARVTVSQRTLAQDAYETKLRRAPDREIVPIEEFDLQALLDAARRLETE